VFEFGENRVPVYPATVAVFIAKFDFQTSVHLDCAIGSWGQAKIPGQFCPKCDFNLIQFTLYQLAQNSRGRPVADATTWRRSIKFCGTISNSVALFQLNSLARLLCRILQDHFASGPLNN
jgi:hypothetical protein